MSWLPLLDLVVAGPHEPYFSRISSIISILEKHLQIQWLKIYSLRSPVTMSRSPSFVQDVIWISRSVRKACPGKTIIFISENMVRC